MSFVILGKIFVNQFSNVNTVFFFLFIIINGFTYMFLYFNFLEFDKFRSSTLKV